MSQENSGPGGSFHPPGPSCPEEASTSRSYPDSSSLTRRPSRHVNEDIELSRRAVPVLSVEPDVCSICLDSFTDEDPGKFTACGHPYHLQCIMQWAQRSRECPLCFKPLVMQEQELNELLPFGEFMPQEGRLPGGVSPQMWMGLDAWELERLLSRLTSANQANTAPDRRRIRLRPRFRNLSLHPTGDESTAEPSGTNGNNVERASGSILDFGLAGEAGSSSTQGGATPDQTSPSARWSTHSPTHSGALVHLD
ncbi:hypothetical protein WJX84_001798 [Apatococcus fuscideae]|uniref:RING-type E3 ubiquitin transferase n=1 Tax=Apatococcus fuscideae TaxID=2026836 RepID=A0AAW1RXB8_9CHLO